IVEDHGPGDARPGPEGVLQTPDEVLGRLLPDHLAVALAGVGQHDPEEPGPLPFPTLHLHPGAFAKINLALDGWGRFHSSERGWVQGSQLPDVALDALVAAQVPVFGPEILKDPAGR